jgi:uncharacterized membrane protein
MIERALSTLRDRLSGLRERLAAGEDPAPGLRQRLADLGAAFWLRPAAMTVAAVLLAQLLIGFERPVDADGWLAAWVYAGGVAGARDVLGAIAGSMITVAGATFSITVAALTLASSQMGPRLLRNFTRDPGNQYALGAFLATFAYALTTLRSVHETADFAFVPELALAVAMLLAFACVGVLIWFLHHVATSIDVDRVVALVQADLAAAVEAATEAEARAEAGPVSEARSGASAAPLRAPGGGYLRVLDDGALADWAAEADAALRLRVRPGDFVFPGAVIGEVRPAGRREAAQEALARAVTLGEERSGEQDLEVLVRQLVEIALRALSPGLNDPFTAVAVLDRLGAALCAMAGRRLPDGRFAREGRLRLERPAVDYAGLLDAMLHPIRQAGAATPMVAVRLLEVLAEVAAVERDPARRDALRRHADLARDAALAAEPDASAREAVAGRHAAVMAALDGAEATRARLRAPAPK